MNLALLDGWRWVRLGEVCKFEYGTGLLESGNTDILAFSSDGDISIIECKLASPGQTREAWR